jgi:hypothetical protein
MTRRRPACRGRIAVLALPAALALVLAVAACSAAPGADQTGSPSTGTPGTSPVASQGTSPGASSAAGQGGGVVESADAAVAAIRARTPWFDGVGPKQAATIGQAAWWTAIPSTAGTPPASWSVTIVVGWGDCPSGCINRHQWRWTVASEGTVTFLSETGPALPADVEAQLAAAATSGGIGGHVTAGPVCPVQRLDDPTCDPRSVNGAVLLVKGADGTEVARFTTDASGLFRFALPAGSYRFEPQPVEGLMGSAKPASVDVVGGKLSIIPADYDTGIR